MKLHSFENLANNSKDAIDIIYGGDYHYVIIYDRKEENIRRVAYEVFEEIKRRNAEISDINEQMLPTNPYYFDCIDGCLPVKCCEISMNAYGKNKGCIAPFTGFNDSVLVGERPNFRIICF